MLKKIRTFFSQYSWDFWVFILIIFFLTRVMVSVYVAADAAEYKQVNAYIFVFCCAAIVMVFLIQPNRKYRQSPFEWIASKVTHTYAHRLSAIELNNNKAKILVDVALLVSYSLFFVYDMIADGAIEMKILNGVIIVFLIAAIVISSRQNTSRPASYCYIIFFLTLPIVVHIAFGGFTRGFLPQNFLWIFLALILSMFLVHRKMAQYFFKAFVIILFLEAIAEIVLTQNKDMAQIFAFLTNVFFLGFVIYSSLELFVARSIQNYSMLEELHEELKDAQANSIQKEKMVTLGQLIAGVAHEINTPIGAIKASSETLESSTDTMLKQMMKNTRDFSDDDLDFFFVIIGLSNASIKEMRSTLEMRRAKKQVAAYLESINIDRHLEMTDLLARLEICSIEKIEKNIDLFRRENMLDILKNAVLLLPMLNSTQSIKFASDKVAKIVFALKSYSYVNSSREFLKFDIVKNIETILILYHNLLKSGVEVVKDIEENLPLIMGNSDELAQVWTNIIQNAIYAMNGVGTLTITIKEIQGNRIQIQFADTGTGISPENIKKIFVPFFTTKPLGEGSGLGLDISNKVILSHGGMIEVSSKLGQGTVFSITLPLEPA